MKNQMDKTVRPLQFLENNTSYKTLPMQLELTLKRASSLRKAHLHAVA